MEKKLCKCFESRAAPSAVLETLSSFDVLTNEGADKGKPKKAMISCRRVKEDRDISIDVLFKQNESRGGGRRGGKRMV